MDFIINDAEVAIEVKISTSVQKSDLRGLIAFCEEHQPPKAIVVSQDPLPRKLMISDQTVIDILPWQIFLERLWQDEII